MKAKKNKIELSLTSERATERKKAEEAAKNVTVGLRSNAIASLHALPEGEVTRVGYSLFTAQDVLAYSVMEITAINGPNVGQPPGCNTDPRLGATRHSEICVNCGLPGKMDSGHYAHINLNCHLINPITEIKTCTLYATNMLCDQCGKPVIPEPDSESIQAQGLTFIETLKAISERSAGAPCTGYQKDGTKCGGHGFNFDVDDMKIDRIGTIPYPELSIIFDDLSVDDLLLMGFPDKPGPSAYILSIFPVIPHRNRLSAITSYGNIDHHKASRAYDKIYTAAQKVREAGDDKVSAMATVEKAIDDLYTNAYDGTITDKETGINRNELEGKPVAARRAVIVPTTDCPVTHGKIPYELAKHATIRQTVIKENMQFMHNLLRTDRIKVIYPGNLHLASGIRLEKGKLYELNIGDTVDRCIVNGDKAIFDRPPTLHEAGIVPVTVVIDYGEDENGFLEGPPEHMDNAPTSNSTTSTTNRTRYGREQVGVVFNENAPDQANIFRKLLAKTKSVTLGITLPTTEPKAGDFDGDEDAALFPQGEDSMVEMDEDLNIRNYPADPKDQKAMFAPVFDAPLGAYVATSQSLPADWKERENAAIGSDFYTAADLASCVEIMEKYSYVSKEYFHDLLVMLDSPLVERPIPYIGGIINVEMDEDGELHYSGPLVDAIEHAGLPFEVDGVIPAVNLLTLILPRNCIYSDANVTVVGGVVTKCKGVTKDTIGPSQYGLVTHLTKHHSPDTAVNFITDATWVFTSFISFRGFSIGIGDCLPATPEVQAEIDEHVLKMYKEIELDIPREPADGDRIRKRAYDRALARATNDAVLGAYNSAAKMIKPNNGLLIIIKSKAKGDIAQLHNLVAILGWQYEDGKIVGKALTNGTRTCYDGHPDDPDPMFIGFVANSLSRGDNPVQSMYRQKKARTDFIVMSQDTPIVGQASKEISAVMLNVMVGPEGEVRDPHGIISYTFAGDNFNPMRLLREKVDSERTKLSVVSVSRLADMLNAE